MNSADESLDYGYVIVIAATRDRVWEGLTTARFTRQYWHNTRVKSDFVVGSGIKFLLPNDEVGCEGKILEADHPKKLAYTWHFPRNPQTQDEKRSRVTFHLKAVPGGTKLTLIHDQFSSASRTRELVTDGWPLVLSGLKTLLETGTAIDFSAQH